MFLETENGAVERNLIIQNHIIQRTTKITYTTDYENHQHSAEPVTTQLYRRGMYRRGYCNDRCHPFAYHIQVQFSLADSTPRKTCEREKAVQEWVRLAHARKAANVEVDF